MTTFTENLNNAKTAQDKYFFEGGGARKASNALLAALMLGFSPAIAADNSVVTNSSPLAGEARWGVNSNETLTPDPSARGAGEVVMLASADGNDLFSLNQVQEKGENTITKFQYNDATGAFEPVFYKVEFTKTDLGHPDVADAVHYFKYTSTDGSLGVSEGTADDYDFSYSVDNNRLADSNIYSPTNNNDVDKDFINSSYKIDNSGKKIGNITGNFIGNTSDTVINNYDRWGSQQIDSIEGNFIGNTGVSIDNGASGLSNSGVINKIKGNFIGNADTAITNYNGYGNEESIIGTISGTFIENMNSAIRNRSKLGVRINSLDDLNAIVYVKMTMTNTTNGESLIAYRFDSPMTQEEINSYIASGGKILFTEMEQSGAVSQDEWDAMKEAIASGELGPVTSEPIDIPEENIFDINDVIANNAPIDNSLFIGNKGGDAGAIYNNGTIGIEVDSLYINTSGIRNSSFYNNVAISEDGHAKAGAIYSRGSLNITADNGESIFSGNKAINNGVEEDIAIYMGADAVQGKVISSGGGIQTYEWTKIASTLNLDAKNNGLIYFDDKIDGEKGGSTFESSYNGWDRIPEEQEGDTDRYNVELTGDGTGKIVLNNDVLNADLRMNEGANVYLGREDVWDSNNVTLNGGSLFLLNNKAGTANFDTLSISADTDLMVDVDLANSTMDRISADSYGELNGNINVVGMNLLSDAQGDNTEILFADNELKNNVTYGGAELPDNFQTTAYTPIYKYDVAYGVKDDGGYFTFNRLGGSSGGSDAFNPAVLGSPVASQAANQSALNEVFHYSYEHVDSFTKLPAFERYAKINANKYAMSTDFNDNMPSYAEQLYNKGVWFKPFTTFESLPLKNGPKVDAITYGSLVGFDTDFKELGNGWHSVFSGFAGYVGSSLNYSGVDSTMNGGLLGFTETFYKGNFWTAVSATAGASVGETHNMYGKEDYTSLLAGVGSKTGYNFEFKDGKFIIQPIMYLGYTFVNTFDYKNSAGVNIESDPLHTIQINPSVRFIANLKGGWQPYASVGMVWNLMNETKATANNVRLPEMSVKPYVEYGVGVQRNWADKFTAFLQAMIRNGGRNGISLTGGFRFMLGSDDDNDSPKVKKEIKSL